MNAVRCTNLARKTWEELDNMLKARALGTVALMVLSAIAAAGVPVIYKHIVDNLAAGHAIEAILILVASYHATEFTAKTLAQSRQTLFAPVLQRIIMTFSMSLLEHLHTLSYSFHLDRKIGGLTRTIDRGAASIELLIDLILFTVAPVAIELCIMGIVLLRLYPPAFMMGTAAIVLVYASATISLTVRQVERRRKVNTLDVAASTVAIDSLINYETVKYFGNESLELNNFRSAKQKYQASTRSNRNRQTSVDIIRIGVTSIGGLAIMSSAAVNVMRGDMTVGDFILINAYLLQLYAPLSSLGSTYVNIRQSAVDLEKVMELLLQEPHIKDPQNGGDLHVKCARIVFDKVWFSYDTRRTILNNVSFEIAPGKTVGLVGTTGSGKSTIARLLFRFFDVDSGSVSIDGQDVRSVTQSSLRAAIGVVPQDTVLFNDTILYNIAYGRPAATKAAIEDAARRASIHDVIATWPDGYNTLVGERGLKLSGGEKQRIAIARVILKQPSIMIFDEATSALDSRTESDVQTSLRSISLGCSTLVIAHRLSTVTHADEILVLDHGSIIERGNHEALLRQQGMYSDLWHRQQRGQEVSDSG